MQPATMVAPSVPDDLRLYVRKADLRQVPRCSFVSDAFHRPKKMIKMLVELRAWQKTMSAIQRRRRSAQLVRRQKALSLVSWRNARLNGSKLLVHFIL